jgi:hypothetical protein
MYIEFMRSWLQINIPHYSAKWTDCEVLHAMPFMPPPTASYQDWHAMVAGEETAPQVAEDKGDPVERLKREHSHLFEAGIVRIGA